MKKLLLTSLILLSGLYFGFAQAQEHTPFLDNERRNAGREADINDATSKDNIVLILSITTNSGNVFEDAIVELVGSDTIITDTTNIPGSLTLTIPLDIYTINIYAEGYLLYSGELQIIEPYYIYEIMLIEPLSPPENVNAIAECNDVHLIWEHHPENPWNNSDRSLTGFNIYRNDELMNDTPHTDTTFTDADVPPGIYSYEVTSIYTTGESESTETLAEMLPHLPASNLSAEHQGASDVLIGWEAPSFETTMTATPELTGYHLYRASSIGDTVVFELPVTSSYLDENLPVPANEITYTYWVVAHYDNGCLAAPSNTDAVTFISNNIENPGKEKVMVYPNPSNKAVHIKLNNKAKQIEIINRLGQVIYQKLNPDKDLIYISHLESGVYSVKVSFTDNTIISKTIIVSR